jgi:hypothetical protein
MADSTFHTKWENVTKETNSYVKDQLRHFFRAVARSVGTCSREVTSSDTTLY